MSFHANCRENDQWWQYLWVNMRSDWYHMKGSCCSRWQKYLKVKISTTRYGNACFFCRNTWTRIQMGSVKSCSDSLSNAVADWRAGILVCPSILAKMHASATVQVFDSHNGNSNPFINSAGLHTNAFFKAMQSEGSSWLFGLFAKLSLTACNSTNWKYLKDHR